MDIDTRLLRYFAAVAAEGNLTRAAQQLYISQPALSKQIKQLETQLGVVLFERERLGVALTPAGSELAQHLPDLLESLAATLRKTKQVSSECDQVLRVGFMASAANEYTAPILRAFAEQHPRWRISMRQTGWSDPSEASTKAILMWHLCECPALRNAAGRPKCCSANRVRQYCQMPIHLLNATPSSTPN